MSTSFAAQRAAYAAGRVLRVVNWHNTLPSDEPVLRAQLAGLLATCTPVGLDDLDDAYAAGRWPAAVRERPALLPVFYDGYRDGHDVAARVCGELGVRALFMPPTAFLSTPVADQRAFADAHDVDLVPGQGTGERLAMTWGELAALAAAHTVGGHTATHARAASIVTDEDIAREVTEPVRLITERTGSAPAAWAFLGGTPFDASLPAWRAVRAAGVRYALSNTAVERIA